jgi:hypothetical protein
MPVRIENINVRIGNKRVRIGNINVRIANMQVRIGNISLCLKRYLVNSTPKTLWTTIKPSNIIGLRNRPPRAIVAEK